jgi:hypothetical protein
MKVQFEFKNESIAAEYYQKNDDLRIEHYDVKEIRFEPLDLLIITNNTYNGSIFRYTLRHINFLTLIITQGEL